MPYVTITIMIIVIVLLLSLMALVERQREPDMWLTERVGKPVRHLYVTPEQLWDIPLDLDNTCRNEYHIIMDQSKKLTDEEMIMIANAIWNTPRYYVFKMKE